MATRILVVDDSPTIRSVVSAILERSGYDPQVASDGEDAYEALASGEVKADLVLVDFVMPRMDGYQLCLALRQHETLHATPVVLMSAKADRIREQFVQQTGALDAITKPFDAQALLAVIENALRRVTTGRGSSARLLPDLDADETIEPLPRFDLASEPDPVLQRQADDTQRAGVGGVIAHKLAVVVAATLARQPELARSSSLADVLAEDLGREGIADLLESLGAPADAGPRALLEGDLGVVPIGAILQLLQSENQTGVLVCTSGSADVRATFRDGAIDLVQSTGAGDEFRLGRFFIEEGILTPAQIEDVMELSRAAAEPVLELGSPRTLPWGHRPSVAPPTGRDDPHGAQTLRGSDVTRVLAASTGTPRPLGMALLAARKIDEPQLRKALARQSSELLYEVLRWRYGRFELRRESPSELADQARLGLPVASVVMEGFRRVDEWRLLERSLGSFDAILLRDDAALGPLDLDSLPPRERAVLDAVDGRKTVRAVIAASHLSSFEACRILVQLMEARAIRRRAR